MILVRTLGVAALLTAALGTTGCVGDASTSTSVQASSPPLPTPTPAARDNSAFVAAVDALAADALQHGPIAGLSIAVSQADTTILAKGYGFADLEAVVPATADTSYPIASVSKNFTAALILRLADRGRLTLDDPLSRFFPDARPKIGALTLRHLLDHTSGLTRGGPAPRTAAQSVLRRGGTAHDQGATWDYSNYNYSLLGLAIEQVTGREYASYVHEELAAPLGLAGTGYCEDGSPVPGRARDYLSNRKRVSPTPYWTKAHFFAGGGLCSTVLDLVRWTRALEDGRVISTAMLQTMRTPARLPGALDADYGLGTRMGSTAGHRKVGHTGGGQGNRAVLARYPDADLTVVVLLNTERANAIITATGIEERIARLFFAPEAFSEDVSPEPDSRRYAGDYRSGSQLVRLAEDAGVLTVLGGARRIPGARYIGRGAGLFVAADDPSVELRFQVRDAQVDGYRRYRNGWFAGVAVRSTDLRPTKTAP